MAEDPKANGDTETVAQNGSKNEKQEESKNVATEPSDLEKQIIRQIEYYFGDINLPKDKFMLEQIKLDEGWIPMSVMLKFQRLAKLSSDPKVIAEALHKSHLMEVDETGEEIKIRRSPEHPLPEFNEERRKELQERSIYCKGFPLDSVMDNLITFFNPYGPLENILMRKYKDQVTKTFKFKGSVFATFANKEKAKEFLDIESVKFNETELIRKWQLDYIEEKKKELLENKLKRSNKKAAAKENDLQKESLPKGATIHLKGDFKKTMTREDIKSKFSEIGYETAFIAFNRGDEEAYVRLQEENAGKALLEKAGKEIEIIGSKLDARLLEGEEEEKFLEKALADRNAYMKKCQQARHGGRKGKGGKGSRKRKSNAADEDSPPAKRQAAE